MREDERRRKKLRNYVKYVDMLTRLLINHETNYAYHVN